MHKRHERERSWYGRMSKSGIDDTGLRCARSKVLRNREEEDVLGGFQILLRLLRVGEEGELGEGGEHWGARALPHTREPSHSPPLANGVLGVPSP